MKRQNFKKTVYRPSGVTNKVRASQALAADVVQAESLQIKKAVLEGKQILRVSNVATQSQLATGNGAGGFRLCVPLPGAYINKSGGDVYVDSRGTVMDISKVTIRFRNRFSEDIEIRANTPFTYVMGSNDTHARSTLRKIVLKPNDAVTIRSHINIHNTLRFPPKTTIEYDGHEGTKDVTVLVNAFAAMDYIVVIPDAPQVTGAMPSADTTSSQYSKSADVCEVQALAHVKMQLGIQVEGVVQVIQGPTLAHVGLKDVKNIVEVDPQTLIAPTAGSLTSVTAMRHLRTVTPDIRAVTPEWIHVTEGTERYMTVEQIHLDGRAVYRLVECKNDGSEKRPLSIRSLEDADIRLIGPGLCVVGNDNSQNQSTGTVYDEYAFDPADGEWFIMSGGKKLALDYDTETGVNNEHPVMNKQRPLMYYNIASVRAGATEKGFWGDLLGTIQGTIEFLERGATVASMIGLI